MGVGASVTVTVLGSSDAFCSGGHPHVAYLVESAQSTFLMDSGPTLLLAMKQRGLDPAKLDFAVISHMHGDHFAGLPFLLLEYTYEAPRSRPFLIVGPPGIEERIWNLFRALYSDISRDVLPFELQFQEMEPDTTFRVGDVDVLAVRVPHQDEEVSLAYRFTVAGKQIVYSGDSPWIDRFIDLSADADLFVCECTAYEKPMGRHVEWTTFKHVLPKLRCRRLVLTHLGREMRAHAAELGVECATEGLKIEL
jgi:ribonuclease BN (tRNA processing enzyme)